MVFGVTEPYKINTYNIKYIIDIEYYWNIPLVLIYSLLAIPYSLSAGPGPEPAPPRVLDPPWGALGGRPPPAEALGNRQ